MKKRDEAVAKITAESQGNKTLTIFEEYLTSICTNDIIAEKILDSNKKLKDCVKTVADKARKQACDGCAMVEDEDVYRMTREYYGIEDEDMNAPASYTPSLNVIDITDLL